MDRLGRPPGSQRPRGRPPSASSRPAPLPVTAPPAATPAWKVVLSLALLAPAALFLVTSYYEPLVWTVRMSFQRLANPGDTPAPIGTANYQTALRDGFGGSVWFALSLALLPLLVVLVIAPLLAWTAHRAGAGARWLVRACLALPLAAFAPVALAAGWRVDRPPADLQHASGVIRDAYGLTLLGLVCAVAVTLYLAALRRRDPSRRPGPGFIVAIALATLATVAAALQEFTYSFVLGGGMLRRGTATPLLTMFNYAANRFAIGTGAAVATLLLTVLAGLGLLATLLVLLSGVRLEVDPGSRSADEGALAPRRRAYAGLVAALLVAGVLAIAWYAAWPWLRMLFLRSDVQEQLPVSDTGLSTWFPPLISTVIGVGAAALAGYAIGALRPFGARSELLLLPFGPFLFVGVGPLALRAYFTNVEAAKLDTLTGLIPPTRLIIPALFVFALLARGQAMRAAELRDRGERPRWVRTYLWPGLPMLAGVAVVTWIAQAQDLLWPMLSTYTERVTGPVAVIISLTISRVSNVLPVGMAMPPLLVIVLVVAAIVLQLGYLDRLALRIGPPERPDDPWQPPGRR